MRFDRGARPVPTAPLAVGAPHGAAAGPATRWVGTALVVAVAAALATLLTPWMLDAVVALGRGITASDVAADYVKGVLWAIALGFGLLLWPVTRDERRVLIALWVVRCVVTLGFMLLYEWNYASLDAYGYFQASQLPAFDWSTLRLGGGTELTQALAWLHGRWLVASYHAMKVSCSMLGLLAVFIVYRTAGIALGRRNLWILAGLACFPSILFWSSTLGKDAVVLFGIALFAHGATTWLRLNQWRAIPFAAVGLLVAVAIRLWMGPILLAPLAVVAIAAVRGWGRRLAVLTVSLTLFALLLVPLRQFLAVEALRESLEVVQASSQAWAEGGSAQVIAVDFTNPVELLLFIPRGAAAALFRPLPGEVMNPFGMLAGLENLLVLVLLGMAIVRARLRELTDPVLLWATTFVLLWAVVYGPISYQNLGTAVRFRLQVLPTMLLVLAYLARPRSTARDGDRAAIAER